MATSLFGPGIGIGNRNGNRVNPPNWNFVNRPPTVNDNQVAEYTVGDFWMDMSASPDPVMWVLVSLEGNSMSIGAQATWVEVTTGGGTFLNTLTGDDAIPVTPLANNIDILAQATAGATVGFSGAVPHQLHLGVTDAGDNTTIGLDAGNVAMTATNCTAVGLGALQSVTNSAASTAMGSKTLNSLTSGLADNGFGSSALMKLTTGNANVAVGNSSQINNVTGGTNVSIGNASLQNLVSGNQNFSAGHFSGSAFTTNESNNIMIGNAGVVSDNNTTRIGAVAPGTGQIPISKTFIYGVDGVNVGSTANVVTEVGNQLGTAVITAGGGIVVTPGPNEILISASGAPASAICAFAAYNSVSRPNYFTVPGTTTITFDQTFFNIGNNYNTGTNTFTAPVSGQYLFNMSVSLDTVPNTIDSFSLELVTTTNTYLGNNNSPTAIAAAVGPSSDVSQTFLVFMNAGDTARVDAILGHAGNCGLSGFTGAPPYRTTFSGTFVDTTGSATAGTTVAFFGTANAENNVTGDGTVFSLGAATAMTTVQNIGGGFFPGNGAGTPASFTAPVTGTYILATTLATHVDGGGSPGGVVQGYSLYLNGAGYAGIYGFPTLNQCTGFFGANGNIDGSGAIVTPLTAGDVITWVYVAGNQNRTASIVTGTVSGALLTTSSGANQFPTDAGTATPLAGVLDINGDGLNINTTGSGHTVNVNLTTPVVVTSPVINQGTVMINAGGVLKQSAQQAWTPVLTFGGASVGIVYSVQVGTYVWIGNTVFFRCTVQLTNKGSSTGGAAITGLPHEPTDISPISSLSAFITYSGQLVCAYQGGATAEIILWNQISGVDSLQLDDTAFANNSEIIINGSYILSS